MEKEKQRIAKGLLKKIRKAKNAEERANAVQSYRQFVDACSMARGLDGI